MAEQIVSDVLAKLGDLLIKEYFFLRGVSDQLDLVKMQLGQMRSFLRDAEEKKIKGDNRTQQWVRDVRDVAFEIQNAVDKYVVEIHNVKGKHVPIWKRCILTEWRATHKLGNKISAIQTKISKISENRNLLGIQNLGEGIVEERPLLRNPVVPDIDNEEIVGFEVERKKIIDALIDGASTQRRRVVSIVGPGGLGKTTLAKKIYNNTEVKQYFNLHVWLTISKDFKPIYVLKKLYEEVTGDKKDKMEEDQVYFSKIYNILGEKTYLIVLDDVWKEDVFEWLKEGFPDVENGSKVIITTRNLNVAIDPARVFELPFLNKEKSLELLLKNALQIPNPSVNCPDELRDVANKLADRCDGLPLAIVVLGRLLFKKPRDPIHWSQVEKNLDWYRDGERCMNILNSSYHDLPYYLKSCFRYLACFPEDHAIDAKSLLRMWIAEGFMDHNKKGTLEDEAERCLEELAQRSLIQVVERYSVGSIMYFRVHDLLRDVAIHKAIESDSLVAYNNENTQTELNRAHRVVIHDVGTQNKNLENVVMPNVRSFFNFDKEVRIGIRYPLLRVLEVEGNKNFKKLPKGLKSMIHLRYLRLSDTGLERLPETIGCLQNLQTLDISRTNVKQIPSSLWEIQALRHVFFDGLLGPPPLANLVNLQSLLQISVPKAWRNGLPYLTNLRRLDLKMCQAEEENGSFMMPNWNMVIALLGTLNNLVELDIEGDSIPVEIIDVKTSPSYQHLQRLYLDGSESRNPPFSTRLFLDHVEMPRNLVALDLQNCWFDKDPMPKLEKLSCFKSLNLWGIENVEEMVCSAGGFPQLKTLDVSLFNDLKHWKVEGKAMPLLENLKIRGCRELSVLPDLKHVTTLQELCLSGMPDVLRSQLKDRTGDEWQKIQHIPTPILFV